MILERVIEDSMELLDQDWMNSPMSLTYFYGGSPHSDTSSSPSHSLSPGPCSPTSDDGESSLSASWPRTKKAEQGSPTAGRQTKGNFQGVRVKNSVRELLSRMRNKTHCGTDDLQNSKGQETCTELKNILSRKRTNDFLLDAPATKKACTFQSSSFLTPPNTPNPGEIMDDTKSEMSGDSSSDLLSLINIKNESQPVSLNTVRVDWDMHAQGQFYQQMAQSFSPHETTQAFTGSSPQHKNDQYHNGVHQVQNLSPQYSEDYTIYSEGQNYQETQPSIDVLENCAIDSYLSLIESTSEIPIENMPINESVIPTFDLPINPPCSQYLNHNVVQSSPNISPPSSNRTSPFQIGKSFFHWQIEQEEKKLANVSSEQLISKDADGDTCLHIAVAQGRRALSYVIAQKMASLQMLDIKEHNNQSALQVAVAADQHLIVQDLVSFGAQINTTDHWGRTPLHVCAEKGYSQVLLAIQKGMAASNQHIDVDATNYDGLTPLHCAVIAHNAIVQRQQFGTPATEDLLMKNKAMVDTVKTLLQMGASIDSRDRKSGRTALHLACEEANLELMSLFLESPNSLHFINAKAYNGNTALHVAASLQSRRAHVGAVRLLMRKGADPSSRNLENEQPVHLVPEGAVGEEIRRVLKGKTMQHRLPSY